MSFQATLERPYFAMFADYPGLTERLFGHLGPYGLRLSDIRYEAGTNMGEASLDVSLLDYRVPVHVRLDRLDIDAVDLDRVAAEDVERIAIDLVAILAGHMGQGRDFRTYGVILGFHGRLTGTAAPTWLSRFTTNPPPMGTLTGSGASFYYNGEPPCISAGVTIDLSGVVAEGLFIRHNMLFDGRAVRIGDLGALSRAQNEHLFRALDIETEP